MTGLVCNYAILRFLPYRETEEFVNVGVVLYCPQVGFYGFRCELRRRGRVNSFFPELETNIFREGLRSVKTELSRVQRILGRGLAVGEIDLPAVLARFRELVRSREGLFHFGGHGALLAQNPTEGLEQLYKQFVLRQFAQHPEYHESIMRKRLDESLRQWNYRKFYKLNRPVGNDRFKITFPFVHAIDGRPRKVIKPLDLDRRDSTEVYVHADFWLNAMRRLKRIGAAPDLIVFPVHMPEFGEKKTAAQEAARDLEAEGAIVVPIEDEFELHRAVAVESPGVALPSR